MSLSPIQQHIRQAAAHEDAAGRHEDKYEQQMKSAGAAMYAAFSLALAAAPDYVGRRLDEKAVARIYASTTARPWWDKELAAAGLTTAQNGTADRDRAKRLIQWHVDPAAAAGRRAQRALQDAARRKALNAKSNRTARGPREAPKPTQAREAVHAARVTEAATASALGGRERELPGEDVPAGLGVDDLLREVNRISSAARKVGAQHREEVLSVLVSTARDIERYV